LSKCHRNVSVEFCELRSDVKHNFILATSSNSNCRMCPCSCSE